jgi:hypothetical protein
MTTKMTTKWKDKYILYGGLCIVLLYLVPLVLLGENSLISIHDNLGHFHPLYKILAEDGHIFASNHTQIPNLLNGVPRLSFGTEFNVYLWLFYFLGPFYAYVANMFFIHFLAFWGMYRLLTKQIMPEDSKLIIVGIATVYGLLPFVPIMGLSVAGQALALSAFLTIRKGESQWSDWLILVLMPLYSNFITAFVFFLFFIGLIWLYDLLVKKDWQIKFLSAITLMTVLYLGVEYRLVHAMFFDHEFESVRTEFRPSVVSTSFLFTLHKALMHGVTYFSWSFYYGESLQTFFIIPTAIMGVFIIIDRELKNRTLIYLILLTAFLSFAHSFLKIFWNWQSLQPIIEQFTILRTFRFYRFYTLYPLLWYLIFALSLKLIVTHSRKGTQILCVLLMLQVGYAFYQHDEIQQLNNKPTYRGFYATKLFSNIENFIGKNKKDYKVASVGIYPAVASYNGFYSLDGYMGNYPLEHKHAFRKIIAKELDKKPRNKTNFDKSGVRCYIFASELAFSDWIYTKERNATINNLDLNIEAFEELGGEYIFSAVKINHPEENQLELLKVFEDGESAWKIFLYRPANPESPIPFP